MFETKNKDREKRIDRIKLLLKVAFVAPMGEHNSKKGARPMYQRLLNQPYVLLRILMAWSLISLTVLEPQALGKVNMSNTESIYDIEVTDAAGKTVSMSKFKGKLLLIVNVASKCGFTRQYEGLEKLFKTYEKKGLMILGFPCNQFGAQEPGSDKEIQQFCKLNYGVSFPVMGKINVNGKEQSPLYAYLKSQAPGVLGTEAIKWNFTKFLVSKDGKVLERYAPKVEPAELEGAIEKNL